MVVGVLVAGEAFVVVDVTMVVRVLVTRGGA